MNYYLDISVDIGIGAADGSSPDNYIGLNQLESLPLVDNDTIYMRGSRSFSTTGINANLQALNLIFDKWPDSNDPWRMYFAFNTSINLQNANDTAIFKNGIIKTENTTIARSTFENCYIIIANASFSIYTENNNASYKKVTLASTLELTGNLGSLPSLDNCLFLHDTTSGQWTMSGFVTTINGLKTTEPDLTETVGDYFATNPSFIVGAETIVYGAGPYTTPEWNDADLSKFNLDPIYGVAFHVPTSLSDLVGGNNITLVPGFVLSNINTNNILAIPTVANDSNFDNINKWDIISVVYENASGQKKYVSHRLVDSKWTGKLNINTFTNTGLWQKRCIIIRDKNGDSIFLDRATIGDTEDITIL